MDIKKRRINLDQTLIATRSLSAIARQIKRSNGAKKWRN